jgi:regulator of replication initiation timing
MNLFDILLNSLDYLSKRNIIELIAKIRTEVIVLEEENYGLREQLAVIRRENERFREENTRLTQTIVSYIERDISYMTNQVNKLNSSSTRIVEELD